MSIFQYLHIVMKNHSFFSYNLLITIPGLIVENITSFYKFEKKEPFVQFAEETISARRAADDGTGSEVKGMVQKLKGNSGYGKIYSGGYIF